MMVVAGVLFLVGGLVIWGSLSRVAAKVIVVGRPGGTPVSLTVSLPQDRTTERKLKFATDQIEAKNYNEGVRLLGQILDSPEDYFFKPNPTGNHFVSIRQHVKRLLGKLPEEGLKAYRLRYGPAAERMLKGAIDEGDIKKLGAVSSRFFHTQPGYEATLLLGEHRLDTGEPLAAALTFTRLIDAPATVRRGYEPELSVKTALAWYLAGKTEQATKVLTTLKKTQPDVLVKIGGREVGLFAAGTDPIPWLRTNLPVRFVVRTTAGREHAMPRRDAARSGSGASHNADITFSWLRPHYVGYSRKTGDFGSVHEQEDVDQGVTDAISSLTQTYKQQNLPALCSLRPLVVGDLVLMRTATKLVAVDLRTGKSKWYGAVDKPMRDVINNALNNTNPGTVPPGYRRLPQQNAQAVLHQALTRRIFSDDTYGKLSSDGQMVYCVEGVSPFFSPYMYYPRRFPNPAQSSLKKYNHLVAYGLGKPGRDGKPVAEGMVMWELGGPKGAAHAVLPGAFFLGPPLPLSGRLFAIAETDGQVALHAIGQERHQPAPGKWRFRAKPLWSQPLCQVEQSIETDIYRQTCGASPAYADGIMVCPTGAGVTVAVDVTSQSLLWAYQYPRDENPYNNQVLRGRIAVPQPSTMLRGWTDSGLIIAEGKVLLTPRGSKSLHCLNLEDGALVWRIDRGDSLFVAGVHDGKAVVVGPNYIKAHDLGNSRQVWRKDFPSGVKTAGRGFHHSGVYLLPLDNSHLATVEMKTGEFVVREQRTLAKEEGKLGNLVCVNGWVISQDLDRVQAFHQVSLQTLMARLEKSPRDPHLLSQLGDLLRQKGRLEEAIAYLRRAAEIAKNDDARNRLAKALLQGLGEDFTKYRGHLTELEALTEGKQSVALRLQFLRTVSDEHFKLKEYVPALEALLKLTDFDSPDTQLHPLEDSLLVRRESWVRAQIARFQADAPANIREQIAQQITRRLNGTAEATPDQLRRALRFFGSHPAAEQTRQRLADLLLKRARPPRLEVETLLRRLERSSDAARSREAVARLAEFYRTAAEFPRKSHGLPAAAHYYIRLKDEFGDQVCLDDNTGQQLHDAAVAGDERLRAFLSAKPWPTGHVKAQSAALPQQARSSVRTIDLDTSKDGDPLSRNLHFQYRGGTLFARAGTGRLLWQVSTHQNGVARPSVQYGHKIATRGHLVVLSTGYDLLGIDASPGIADDSKRIRWTHSLVQRTPGDISQDLYPTSPYVQKTPWGEFDVLYNNRTGQPLGSLRPLVGDGQVTFVRGTDLISVDSLSGEVIWHRGGIERGSEVFGDDQRIFTIGRDKTTANAYRATDGTSDGVRQVPPRTQRMAIFGSRVLAWVPQGLGYDLKLVDAQTGKTVWARSFSQTAKATRIGGDEIGIVNDEANGDRLFKVFAVADGSPRFSTPVNDVKAHPTAVYVIRSRQHYVVAVNTINPATTRRVNRIMVGTPRIPNYWDMPLVSGHVYGFDRRTQKRLWDLAAPGIGLPLHQPPESPLLMFMTSATNSSPVVRGRQPLRYVTEVAFVDKRRHAGGGRPYVVHKESIAHAQYIVPDYALTAGPGSKVVYEHPTRRITLTFTADKVPSNVKNPDLSLTVAAGQNGQGGVGQPGFRVPVPQRR